MNIQAPFGFVTGCHAADKFMVQATLASIRHFCPGLPICLVADGEFDVSDLVGDYGVIVLRTTELPSSEMRELVCGNPRAKLAAMWEGPFEYFVWLDSDAIVWGDFTSKVSRNVDFQIFWSDTSLPEQVTTPPDWLKHYYFDPDKLKQFDRDFRWQGLHYFSNGTFACRRNALPIKKWLEALSWKKHPNNPWPNGFYDMPVMTYLVHSLAQRGELKIAVADLQHIWGQHGRVELEMDCVGAGWHFPQNIRRPRVAHFCGRKPILFDRKAYSRPFTIARLEHHRRHHGAWGAWAKVLLEDGMVMSRRFQRRLTKGTKIC